jgi:uncharacterized protein with HEPN domain
LNEPILPLRDILESISRIESFLEGYTFDRFIHDDKTIAAVERKLQIITEAAFRLGEHAELLCPGIPWRNIRGTGNRLRHQYDRVDLETVWITATIDLSTLKASVSNAIASLGSKGEI